MTFPELVVEYTTDDANDPTPTWVDVSDQVKTASWSRGRETEGETVGPGTATIVLEDEDRVFDPNANALIDVMNRWRIRGTVNGGLASEVTEDGIVGYAESYTRDLRVGVQYVTVRVVDELKVLNLDRVPTTDPPRGAYQELVMFDDPQGYWPMAAPNIFEAVRGDRLEAPGGGYAYSTAQGPIVGDENARGYGIVVSTWGYISDITAGEAGDAGGLSEFGAEGWFMFITSIPSGNEILFAGPWTTDGTYSWKIGANSSGQFTLDAKNNAGTTFSLVGTTVAVPDVEWHHVFGTITDGFLRLYVNGVEEDSVAWTGTFEAIDIASNPMWVGNGTNATSGQRGVDELAFYRVGVSAERILAHYQAGAERGFAQGDDPGDRVEDVLDASTSIAARSVRTGTRAMTGSYMTGQAPLTELRKAEAAEAPNGILFVARDGTVTFLDNAHRSVSPWDTVQATFSDDPDDGGLLYEAIEMDFSDGFLANVVNASRTGGTIYTVEDTASSGRRLARPKALNDIPIITDSDVEDIADETLEKYRHPMQRITGLDLVLVDEVAETALALDIGDRIRVFATPVGVESLYPAEDLYPSEDIYPLVGRIEQTLFVQKIEVDVRNTKWTMRLGVSPL